MSPFLSPFLLSLRFTERLKLTLYTIHTGPPGVLLPTFLRSTPNRSSRSSRRIGNG